MAEEFPRIRKNEFTYMSTIKVPDNLSGRLDLICAEEYGISEMYRVLAAANSITNPMALRATIRPCEESIRNELVLRGYKGAELETKYKEAIQDVVQGMMDWLDYDNMSDGVITEVYGGRTLLLPDAKSGSDWFSRYNTLEGDK